MQIAIDGLTLTGKFTGVAKVVLNQITALLKHKYAADIDFTIIVPKDTDINALLGRRDFRVIHAPFNGNEKLKRIIWQQFKMGKILNEMEVDILYSPGYISSLSFKGVKITYIHDTIALKYPHLATTKNALSYRFLLPLTGIISDFIAVPSESSKKDVQKHLHIRPDKVSVVPLAPAIPPLVYTPQRESRYLIAVSAVEPKKNFANLIRWYNHWRKHGKIEHKLYIVGNFAWKYENVIAEYNKSEYRDDILLLGYQSGVEVAKLIAGADLLLMPSLYEGFGLPVLEAMKLGTPVVSSDRGSLPEIVDEAGLVLPLKDKSWQEEIPALLGDKKKLREMSRDGLKRAYKYSWEKVAEDLYEVFAKSYNKKQKTVQKIEEKKNKGRKL